MSGVCDECFSKPIHAEVTLKNYSRSGVGIFQITLVHWVKSCSSDPWSPVLGNSVTARQGAAKKRASRAVMN